jgi:hypothetical protein
MSAKFTSPRQPSAFFMITLTLIAGLMGFVFQLMPDGTMMTFFVGVAAIAGLAGSSKGFDERELQLLWKSYSTAFEFLFMLMYFTYAVVLFSDWLNIATGVAAFINAHWIGLTASTMCTLLGVVGRKNFREVG